MGQYGLTEEEVINIIGEERWNEFRHWMRGQTAAMDDDERHNYYQYDVDRFVENLPIID